MAADQLQHMIKQMTVFKTNLEDFAVKHRTDLKKNPEFRAHFQQMCAQIGVDPLASSKGYWAQTLGVGDYYYELGRHMLEKNRGNRSCQKERLFNNYNLQLKLIIDLIDNAFFASVIKSENRLFKLSLNWPVYNGGKGHAWEFKDRGLESGQELSFFANKKFSAWQKCLDYCLSAYFGRLSCNSAESIDDLSF